MLLLNYMIYDIDVVWLIWLDLLMNLLLLVFCGNN